MFFKVLTLLIAPTLTLCLAGHVMAQTPDQARDQNKAVEKVVLQRATMTVSDADASIRFYRDLLGFTVSSDRAYDSPTLRHMFNIPPDSQPRFVLLNGTPDQPRALAFISADGLEVDREANRLNAPALVITVNRMDEIDLRLQEAEVEVIQTPSVLLGFDSNPIGREAMYLDPDGVRIVLFELSVN